MFESIKIGDWRQFGEVDIRFHDRLTVLTGANASGKTTLLNILAKHFGWNVPLVRMRRSWRNRWLSDFFESFWKRRPPQALPEGAREIGSITYVGGAVATLVDEDAESPTFELTISNQQPVKGLHIPSHRPVPTYQAMETIPARPRTKQEAFDNYATEVRDRYLTGRGRKSTTFHIKETLVSLAHGYGNVKIPRRDDVVETLEGFEEILRKTLPPDLRFRDIGFDVPEVYLNTATGPIPFDAISGGMSSILDMTWQIYMYSGDDPYVVVIDEPENHLHPALQRTLLGNLLAAFPQVQFIVATHSPFVVGSVADSNVYVLDWDDHVVVSTHLEAADKSLSSDGILRDVLGVPSTFPAWADQELQAVVDRYSRTPLTGERLRALKEELFERRLGTSLIRAIDETLRIQEHDRP